MREVGAPSTWGEVVGCPVRSVPGAPRQSWSHHPRSRATRRGGNAKGRANENGKKRENSEAEDIIKARVLHLALLQRGSLILREDCYNVVTRAPTVGNDAAVPDSKRERGVHARYALLGTRSAGGGRRPGDRLGAVPISPPLALAASRGPGLTYRRLPRPANVERGAG